MTTNELPDLPKIAAECSDTPTSVKPRRRRRAPGQALIEYVLIVVLVSLAVVAVLTLTGPIIGNVFSNVVYNLLQQTTVPYQTLAPATFWYYVTVVAQYTPPIPTVQTYTPQPTVNTPTYTPSATFNPTAKTYTPSPTATNDPTVGPSPTLTDIPYKAPFINTADNAMLWNEPFYDAFASLGWTATYYTGASNAGAGGVASSTHVCPTAPASSTPCLSDVVAAGPLAPGYPGVNEIIYKGTAPFEDRNYEVTLTVGAGDSAIFLVNNAAVVSKDNTGGSGVATATKSEFVPGAASYPIEVDYYTSNPNSVGNQVQLNFSTLSDYAGNSVCDWKTLTPGHSGTSWQDAAGGNYQISSNCNLRLRGWIDLNQTGITHPSISFYDQWAFGPSAVAYLGVREYNSNGTTFSGTNKPWQWIPVHTGGQKGSNWSQETFDLTNFGTGGSYVNFMTQTNQRIEIAFKVTNPDPLPTDADHGWFVDDIKIADSTPAVYSIPITDDFDGQTGQVQWTPDCSWVVTNSQNYPDGTPGHSYASNPTGPYTNNSDCSLYLGPSNGGVVDLTSYTGPSPVAQLVFQNKYQINGTTTALTVEYVSATNHAQNPIPWQPLTPNGSSNPWVAKGTMTTNNAWQQEVFNLNVLSPDKYYFRFHMLTDGTAPGDLGWFLDNIQWRNRPVTTAGIPWADTLNNADNWTLSDRWSLTASASGGSGPDGLPHTSPYALTDSPGGAPYDTTGSANNFAQLNTEINIGTSGLCPATFDPVLTFWSHWSVASGATLSVDFSQDSGTTWNPGGSPLWQFMYNQTSDPFQTTTGASYNTNLAWRRFMVDLKSYACNNKTIMIRFHLQVPNGSPPADGWYIDDVAFFDISSLGQPAFANSIACQSNGLCDPTQIDPSSTPFLDGAENPLQGGWYMGSNWQVVSSGTNPAGIVHSGLNAWSVTAPAVTPSYASPQDAIMELASAINLSGFSSNGQKPVLSFWTRYGLATSHLLEAEVMQMPGNPNLTTSAAGWVAPPQPLWIAPTPGGAAATSAINTNLGWTRQLMDLTPFIGKSIRLRFRLEGMSTQAANPGVWLDDVYIGALSQMQGYGNHPLSPVFQDNFSNLTNWVPEGDWQSISDWGPYYYAPPSDHFTPVAYDYGNFNPNPEWDVNYYHYYTTDPNRPTAAGNAWTEPTGLNICSTTTHQQISNFTVISGSAARYTSGMPNFIWTDGTSPPGQGSTGGTKTGVSVSGTAGNGFQFTSVADANQRLIRVYVGAMNTTASISVWLSNNQAGTTQTVSFTNPSTTTTVNKEYDITFSSAVPQSLVFQITGTSNAYTVDLEAAEVLETTTTTATDAISVAAPNPIGNGSNVKLSVPPNENDNSSGTTDWAHWGYSGTQFDHRNLPACVQSILHQQAAQVNFTWDATHIPANAGGQPTWVTDAPDNQLFAAVFKRRMIIDPGEYRFWANADDGVRLLIDGTLIPVSATANAPANPALPYPWTSAGANGWVDQATPKNYFYDFIMPGPSGQHMIEVDYYQHAETTDHVKFLVSETTGMLHSNSAGSNYSANQNTSAFINGYITVPASATKITAAGFYERFDDGSDPMYVAISIDGGFTWYNITALVKDSDPDSPNFNGTVTYGFNHNDATDPFTTYQNWHFHTINLSNATCGGATKCISTTQPTQIALKFQFDTRNSSAQYTGWFITNLTVIQS